MVCGVWCGFFPVSLPSYYVRSSRHAGTVNRPTVEFLPVQKFAAYTPASSPSGVWGEVEAEIEFGVF